MNPVDSERALASRLFIALATPFVLLIAVGFVLTAQIVQMEESADWVTHSDEVIAQIHDLQRQVIDQETGLRGYLVTGDHVFLEPYDRSHPLEVIANLQGLLTDNPAQRERLAEIRRRYDSWAAMAKPPPPGPVFEAQRAAPVMRERKALMDSIRQAVTQLLGAERELHAARAAESQTAYERAVHGLVPLLLVLGAILSLVSRRQIRSISGVFAAALVGEREAREAAETENWIRQQVVRISRAASGEPTLAVLGERVLGELASGARAVVGAFYASEPGGWRLHAGHALPACAPVWFADGEGVVGQAGRGQTTLSVEDVPGDYLKVRSGTGEHSAGEIVLVPLCVDGLTLGVIELGFFGRVETRVRALFERIGEPVAIAVRSVAHRLRLRELLEESQRQAEELQTQQEELRVSNEELQQQSDALAVTQSQLEERKEELEVTNSSLLGQRDALERIQRQLEEKAAELERANRYKSEFLANMSHELRTPLNSSLILAKLLSDNKEGNLTPEQIRFAKTIHDAGNDLLSLINDILDLAKVEAGRLDVHPQVLTVDRLVSSPVHMMEPLAKEKNLALRLNLGDGSEDLETDIQRAQQILLNLLSNALKFTEKGGVTLEVAPFHDHVQISVVDTGIGIAPHQQEVIFEAFRQADGTTNRRYGGTGLGLSISRDLAKLLGGDLTVASEVGKGSRFTLTLPRRYTGPRLSESRRRSSYPPASILPARALMQPVHAQPVQPALAHPAIAVMSAQPAIDGSPYAGPSSETLRAAQDGESRRLLLVVEDDDAFAEILVNLAHELDFDCVVAHTADEGVRKAIKYLPSAVILDMKLPDHSGLSVLDRLKRQPSTRHIPIHIVSVDNNAQAALSMGAVGHLRKPVKREDIAAVLEKLKEPFRRLRRLLVVEDDATQRDAIRLLLEAPDLEIVAVGTVGEALSQLRDGTFDCVVTDLSLPDASGYDFLEKMAADDAYAFPPVVVYTGRALTPEQEQRLRRYSNSIIVKGARSPERLLDEITLFLHQVEAALPPERQRMLRQVRDREAVFDGRKVLLAEDDVRNIFALSSVLEPRGITLLIARNGKEALRKLGEEPDVDLVLMDVMMPEMDGLTAIEEIRGRGGAMGKLPIIAITAKAMKDDQERCLRAGANDFVPKPLDIEVLLSLMRVWMPQ